jgi:hypothetical protein
MQLKSKLLGSGLVILAAGGIGTATAMAQSGASTAPAVHAPAKATASEPVSSPDTDNVQQGDQTSPDVPAATKAGEAGGESEKASESENAPSDGPGGHEDPPGNVDNQQTGNN